MEQLDQVVATAFSKIVASGAIEAAIEKQLTDTIGSIIKEQLRSYSDFGKAVEEQVKASLQVDFSNLGLPGYNDLILKVIRQQVDSNVQTVLANQVEQQMKDLLSPAPTEIKLSELVEQFIKDRSEDAGCSCDGPGRITLIVEDGGSCEGYHHVYLDEKEGVRKYSCAIQIATNKEGHVYSLKIDEKDPKKSLFIGPLYGFERRLFQMYAAGTKLIVDEDPDYINTNYPGHDD